MKEFITTAVRGEKNFKHFGITATLSSMYGDYKPEEILNVKCTITDTTIHNRDKDFKDIEYWGWLENGRDSISLIQPSFFMFEMQFPGGCERSESNGRGKCVNLIIEEIL